MAVVSAERQLGAPATSPVVSRVLIFSLSCGIPPSLEIAEPPSRLLKIGRHCAATRPASPLVAWSTRRSSLHTSGVQLYAFVLMKNHFHLLVKTPRANLSRFMQRLLTRYALYSRYCLGSGAVSAIHRKVQKDWQNILPIVNELALRLQGKRERKNR